MTDEMLCILYVLRNFGSKTREPERTERAEQEQDLGNPWRKR